jgi:hypothetical protein
MTENQSKQRSYFWPILLIGGGVLLLLSNLGYITPNYANLVWQMWPLFLIALGVDILIGRTSRLGTFLSAGLILFLVVGVAVLGFFVQELPALEALTPSPEWVTESISHPLEGYESASVTIDWTSKPGSLFALTGSDQLISGEITYRGDLTFDVTSRGNQAVVTLDTRGTGFSFSPDFSPAPAGTWEIGLSPNLPLDLLLDSGSGRCDFDLSDLVIEDLTLDSGSGAIDLTLPGDRSFEARIESGSGSVKITIPKSVGVRVSRDSGSGAFRPSSRYQFVSGERDDDGVWETENYDTAEYTIDLILDQGSGAVTIQE